MHPNQCHGYPKEHEFKLYKADVRDIGPFFKIYLTHKVERTKKKIVFTSPFFKVAYALVK